MNLDNPSKVRGVPFLLGGIIDYTSANDYKFNKIYSESCYIYMTIIFYFMIS